MPVGTFPDLEEIQNGEQAISIIFNRPLFNLSTRTESLKTLLESVESEVVTARDTYPTLNDRLDTLFSDTYSDGNIFLTGAACTWSASGSSFTHSDLVLVQPNKTFNYTINAATVNSIADNEALYVTLTRDPGDTTLTFTKVSLSNVPTDKDVLVIAIRRGNRLWLRSHGEFEDDETREIGDGATNALLNRLGMTDDNDTASHFTNTTIISIGDNIPEAISKLDLEAEYNIRDRNIVIHGGGNVTWNSSNLTLSSDLKVTVPSVGDVTVAATTINSISDGEVLYFPFIRTGSDYVATLLKVASSSLPLSNGDTDNLVVGYRSGTEFIFKSGDIFQDGETKRLGSGGAGLVSYQNMSIFGSSEEDLSWNATTGELDCVGDVTLNFPWETYNNVIQASEFPITLSTGSKKAYVVLDRSQQANVIVVEDVDSIPITYSQPDAILIAERVDNSVYIMGNRYNDGDTRRLGEGYVAGELYDRDTTISTGSGQSVVTLPGGKSHEFDQKALKVWANGNLLNYGDAYSFTSQSTEVTAIVSEMFPNGRFPYKTNVRFRIESIVTGGAGGGSGSGTDWSTPVDADIVPDVDDTRSIGSTLKGIKQIFLSDQSNSNIFKLFVDSGSLQIVQV